MGPPGPRLRRLRVGVALANGSELGRDLMAALPEVRSRFPRWDMIAAEATLAGIDSLARDGVEAVITRSGLAAPARATLGVPMVVVGSREAGAQGCGTDDLAVGRLAAQTLLTLGHPHLAIAAFHLKGLLWEDRITGFCSVAGDRPVQVARLAEREDLVPWIEALPKPVAIFAVNDVMGSRVLQVCRRLSLAVPGEVAVLGVDDDHFYAEVDAPVPLSSIRQNVVQIVSEAAQRLADLLAGAQPLSYRAIPPLGVVQRASTGAPIAASLVDQAMEVIRRHAVHGLTVDELAQHLAITPRHLRRLFKADQGRNPLEAIREARIAHAEGLLLRGMPVREVARTVGYSDPKQFRHAFRALRGSTPTGRR